MTDDARDQVRLGDLFGPIVRSRRKILLGTLVAAVAAALLGAFYYIWQPTPRSVSLGFRPVFDGADEGRYPNGLPFAPTDIVSRPVIDQVIETNRIGDYCAPDQFRGGVFIQESSPALEFLNLEYQARLGDTRLTNVERQRLQDEYVSRRATIQSQYRLMFIQPQECSSLPSAVIVKALGEILDTWAVETEGKRGVMRARVAVLAPRVFDPLSSSDESLLVRADLVRSTMVRVLTNIAEVQRQPGADVIRLSEDGVSLGELHARMEDLMQARLDPLMFLAGRGMGRLSIRWVEQALQTATTQLQATERAAEAYRAALREYSGVPTTPAVSTDTASERRQSSSDVGSLTPQIDRTFIERIVELSATNTAYRQALTTKMYIASIEAVRNASRVEHYRLLLASTKEPSDESFSTEQVTQKLTAIIAEAKEVTRQFNKIYDEMSRVAFRVSPMMYRIERPANVVTIRTFGLRAYAFMLLGVLLVTPVLLSLVVLLHFHMQRFARSVLRA